MSVNERVSAAIRLGLTVVLIAVAGVGDARGASCDGISRALPSTSKAAFSAAIASQLGASRVDILESFKLGAWQILYVDSHTADEAFLFFSGDPRSMHYVTLWSGGAAPSEEANIRKWVVSNAPGIPPDLAGCFAWHVTHGRGE